MITLAPKPFLMGDNGQDDERPVRLVTIPHLLTMGIYEVTFEEYDNFVKSVKEVRSPSDYKFGRGKRPVINVDWNESVAYARWLSYMTGKSYRLPTEAEWEAAAGDPVSDYDGDGQHDENCCGANEKTIEVGKWKGNKAGLHDMLGNVAEWVEDCWHSSYVGAPKDGSAWLEANADDCKVRVIRGGSWTFSDDEIRRAARIRRKNAPNHIGTDLGFRLVQDFVKIPILRPRCAP